MLTTQFGSRHKHRLGSTSVSGHGTVLNICLLFCGSRRSQYCYPSREPGFKPGGLKYALPGHLHYFRQWHRWMVGLHHYGLASLRVWRVGEDKTSVIADKHSSITEELLLTWASDDDDDDDDEIKE
jgi:hypothetical protein